MIRFVDAPVKYDAANERQFRNQLDQALQSVQATLTQLQTQVTALLVAAKAHSVYP